jgi:hypothetical protein
MAQLQSRIRFLKDGDANTSLFHRQVGFRKTKIFVPKRMKEDQIYTKQKRKAGNHGLIFSGAAGITLPPSHLLES